MQSQSLSFVLKKRYIFDHIFALIDFFQTIILTVFRHPVKFRAPVPTRDRRKEKAVLEPKVRIPVLLCDNETMASSL